MTLILVNTLRTLLVVCFAAQKLVPDSEGVLIGKIRTAPQYYIIIVVQFVIWQRDYYLSQNKDKLN
jgi:predicted RNA-binding protein with PUA domain